MILKYCLGVLLCIVGSFALYNSNGDVVELTPDNFDRLVKNSNEVWIVEFFAPWCGHCKNLVPEYQKAAQALKGIIRIGAIDADSHKSFAQKYGVTGFPTIKIFTGSKHTPYSGARNAEGFIEAGLKAAKEKAYESLGRKPSGSSSDKSDVITLTDSNFKELVLDSEEMWLVEFYAPWCGHCKNLEPQWAKAATELKGKVCALYSKFDQNRCAAKEYIHAAVKQSQDTDKQDLFYVSLVKA